MISDFTKLQKHIFTIAAILLLAMNLWTHLHLWMYRISWAASLIIAKHWEPPGGHWLDKWWYIHVMENDGAIEKSEGDPSCMDHLQHVMLSEKPHNDSLDCGDGCTTLYIYFKNH